MQLFSLLCCAQECVCMQKCICLRCCCVLICILYYVGLCQLICRGQSKSISDRCVRMFTVDIQYVTEITEAHSGDKPRQEIGKRKMLSKCYLRSNNVTYKNYFSFSNELNTLKISLCNCQALFMCKFSVVRIGVNLSRQTQVGKSCMFVFIVLLHRSIWQYILGQLPFH